MTPLRLVTGMPATRAGCIMGVRPCPYTRCRHRLTSPSASCVLDVVEEHGPMTLEEVGTYFGLTRERIRQIEGRALRRLRLIVGARKLREMLASWAHPAGTVEDDCAVASRGGFARDVDEAYFRRIRRHEWGGKATAKAVAT